MAGPLEAVGHELVLGVVGTFVIDRIVGLPDQSESSVGLGGVAYTLAGAAAAVPRGWRLLPLARVGRDAAGMVDEWLDRAALDSGGLLYVDEPNNRVELRYHDDARRTEHLTGGVDGWDGATLASAAAHCDALLVNFISGHELTLEDASVVRDGFTGPVYADLHSLFLGMGPEGRRVPRALPNRARWMSCFDAVQMNGDEMNLLRGGTPMEAMARRLMREGPGLVACTMGSDGAICWSREASDARWNVRGSNARPEHKSGRSSPIRDDGSLVRHEIPAYPVARPDPTGCGDVWAGAMCCRLLAGDGVPESARRASRLSAAAAELRGVGGLLDHLREAASTDVPEKDREEEP